MISLHLAFSAPNPDHSFFHAFAFQRGCSPTFVILTSVKDLPAEPWWIANCSASNERFARGSFTAAQHDEWWERFLRKAITRSDLLKVIARVEEEVIELSCYPDMKPVSSMATSE